MPVRFLFTTLLCLMSSPLVGEVPSVPARAHDVAAAPALDLPRYTITDLGTLGNDGYSGANAINDKGQIVGWSGTDYAERGLRHTRAFLWQNGRMQEIKLPSYAAYPAGYRINNRGQVLIKPEMLLNGSYIGRYLDYGYVWQAGKRSKTSLSGVLDLNNSGQILTNFLRRDTPRPYFGPALWQANRQTLFLDTRPDYDQAFAHAMNDKAQIVGEVVNYDTSNGQMGKIREQHAFLYRDGQMTILETPEDMTMSTAVAVNNEGELLVQGWSKGLHRGTYSLLWKNGQWTDLDREGLFPYINADSLNDRGQVVGNYWTPDTVHAFLWQNGRTTDLNQLLPARSGWKLLAAGAINNNSWIIGSGLHNGKDRAFLLKPVLTAP